MQRNLPKDLVQEGQRPTKSLYSVGEASKLLGISIDTIRRWDTSGKISLVRTPAGTRLVPISEIERIREGDKAQKFYSIGEAAKLLGVSIDTIRRYDAAGKIKVTRSPGGTRLVSASEIERLKKATVTIAKPKLRAETPLPTTQPPSVVIPTSRDPKIVALGKKVLFLLYFTRPTWYRKYTSNPLSRPIHQAILGLLLIIAFSAFFYYWFLAPSIKESDKKLAELGKALGAASAPPRILSFQGRLTDDENVPVDEPTDIIFRIWDQDSGGTEVACDGGVDEDCMWKSKSWTVTPDQNGIFSVTLGDTDASDTAIPDTLFSENASLYLGIKVDGDDEMLPRQRIASSSYALNADALEGYHGSQSPTANQVPILNASGNLMFAGAATIGTGGSGALTLDSDSGTLTLGAGTNTITNTDTNTALLINPNGTGAVQFHSSSNSIDSSGNLTLVGTTMALTSTTAVNLGAATVDFNGAGALQYEDGSNFTIADDGAHNIFKLTGGTNLLEFGNATDNNAYTFLGSGTLSIKSLDCHLNANGGALTASETGVISCSDDDGGGGGARLDQITAATGAGSAQDSNANSIFWNWDFTSVGADSGLTISESSASTNGTQDQQALLELTTLTGSTASPLQITNDSTDVGDIWINLANAGDIEFRDAGTAFATFADDGTITLGKSAAASTIYIGNSAQAHIITIGSASTTDVSITDDNWSISTGGAMIQTSTITDSGSQSLHTITLGNDGGIDTVNAIEIAATSANTGNADILNGININNLASADATVTETAINIGTGWDNSINGAGTLGLSSSLQTGTAVRIGQGVATTLTDTYTLLNVDLSTNYTTTASKNATGITIASPTYANLGTATSTGLSISSGSLTETDVTTGYYNGIKVVLPSVTVAAVPSALMSSGLNITTPTFTATQNLASPLFYGMNLSSAGALRTDFWSTINWVGTNLTLPTINSNFFGGGFYSTVTADAVKITIPNSSVTQLAGAFATMNGINIPDITTGAASGTLNGINIGSIGTPGNGAETAINIGTNWDTELKFSDTTPKINLSATDNTAVLSITDSAATPNNLFQLKDRSTNFGAYAEVGGIFGLNSYFGEEWMRERADVTSDAAQGWGDFQSFSADEQTASTNDCTFSVVDDTAGGIGRIATADATTGCMAAITNTTITDPHAIFDVDNYPVLIMKVRPNSVGANDNFWVGFAYTNGETITNGNGTPGMNYILFGNGGGSNWTGQIMANGSGINSACSGPVAISTTNFAALKIEASTSSISLYIDADTSNGIAWTLCTTFNSEITTSPMSGVIKMYSSTSGHSLDIDYFRVWQDDATIDIQDDPGTSNPDSQGKNLPEENAESESQTTTESDQLSGSNTVSTLILDPGNNLVATISSGAKFVWTNSVGRVVAWVSDTGGAVFERVTALVGNFNKLIFGELVASKDSKTAGTASFEPDQTKVFIESDKVAEDSLVYVTATTKTDGVSLYIKEQKDGKGFTVALERSIGDLPNQATASATQAIRFNWLVVNRE